MLALIKLRPPRWLAIATLVVTPACADEDDAAPSDESTGESGEIPDCIEMKEGDACIESAGCVWHDDQDLCLADCPMIEEESTCVYALCLWDDERCTLPPI